MDPIPQGAELLISYFPITLAKALRQARLQQDYGFTCRCEMHHHSMQQNALAALSAHRSHFGMRFAVASVVS